MASAGAKVFSVGCTLAQVPLALRALGTEAYGLWITLMGLTIMLNLVDFGVGVGMQKAMSRAFGQDDQPAMRRAFFSGFATLGALGLVTLALGLPLAMAVDWGARLKIETGALAAEVRPALVITVAAFALGLPFNAAPRLAYAVQRGWLHAGWIAAGSAGTLAIVAYAARAHWGFLPFLAATALLPTVQGAGLAVHLWWALGWSWKHLEWMSRQAWREMAGESLLFSAPQLGLAFVQAAPPAALSFAAGPAAATAFNLLQRLFSPVTQGQIMVLTPLWPAMTEAHARGERTWIRSAFARSVLVAAGCIVAIVLVTWQSDRLLHWWVGLGAAGPVGSLAWLTCAWFSVQVAWQPLMYLLVGIGRLGPLALWGVVGPVLSLAGMLAAVAFHQGASGVLAGAVVGLALGGLPGLTWSAVRALGGFRPDEDPPGP
jgi:O-antigen/teichoic acid export membrane protein